MVVLQNLTVLCPDEFDIFAGLEHTSQSNGFTDFCDFILSKLKLDDVCKDAKSKKKSRNPSPARLHSMRSVREIVENVSPVASQRLARRLTHNESLQRPTNLLAESIANSDSRQQSRISSSYRSPVTRTEPHREREYRANFEQRENGRDFSKSTAKSSASLIHTS